MIKYFHLMIKYAYLHLMVKYLHLKVKYQLAPHGEVPPPHSGILNAGSFDTDFPP